MISKIDNNVLNLTNKENSNNVFLQNYPVGSIYVSTEGTNPGTKFGGTWVTYGAGRTLVGVDSTQTEFATVGLIGGEKTHTLTIDEMPEHDHGVKWYSSSGEIVLDHALTYYGQNVKGWNGLKTRSAGGSKPHNNLQPYITVYMWKRTA